LIRFTVPVAVRLFRLVPLVQFWFVLPPLQYGSAVVRLVLAFVRWLPYVPVVTFCCWLLLVLLLGLIRSGSVRWVDSSLLLLLPSPCGCVYGFRMVSIPCQMPVIPFVVRSFAFCVARLRSPVAGLRSVTFYTCIYRFVRFLLDLRLRSVTFATFDLPFGGSPFAGSRYLHRSTVTLVLGFTVDSCRRRTTVYVYIPFLPFLGFGSVCLDVLRLILLFTTVTFLPCIPWMGSTHTISLLLLFTLR